MSRYEPDSLDGIFVECPRCEKPCEVSKIWVWVSQSSSLRSSSFDTASPPRSSFDAQAERLLTYNGEIRQSGHPVLFDLECGCAFDTRLWNLRVSTMVTMQRGGSIKVRITPKRPSGDVGGPARLGPGS